MRRLVIWILFLIPAWNADAATHGTIQGVVTLDSTGVPGARISLDSGLHTWSNEQGYFILPIVTPGTYRLSVEAVGYAPLHMSGVTVYAGIPTRVNLPVSRQEETVPVEIQYEAPLINVYRQGSRTLIGGDQITQLPVTTVQEVVMTTPGAFAGTLRNGGLVSQQTFLDGAVITNPLTLTGQAFTVNPYMIQSLEVRTGVYEAGHRDGGAGIIDLATRDGSRGFSGNFEFRTLAQKGLNWTRPPPLDLIDKLRTGESNEEDIRDLIHTALSLTELFNADPFRANDGLRLRSPFDVLDTSSANPQEWTARYNRDNFYWDYDRIIPEAESPGFAYLTQALPLAQANSGRIDRTFNPSKYNNFLINNRTEKRPVQIDWAAGSPIGSKLNWFASGRFAENHGRTPNAYNRLINGFAKLTFQPGKSMKLSASAFIEDRGAFSGKGQRPELVGDNYVWKYIAEGLNERFLGSQMYNFQFTHAPGDNWYYSFRMSHQRVHDESYNPRYGTEPELFVTTPFNTLSIPTPEVHGYNPLEQSGIGGNSPGYRLYGDQVYNLPSGFISLQPRTTEIEMAIAGQVHGQHRISGGWRMTMPRVSLITHSIVRTRQHSQPTEWVFYGKEQWTHGGLKLDLSGRLTIMTIANSRPFNPRPAPRPLQNINFNLDTTRRVLFAPRIGFAYRINERIGFNFGFGRYHQRLLFDTLDFSKSHVLEGGIQTVPLPDIEFNVTGTYREERLTFAPSPITFRTRDNSLKGVELSLRNRSQKRINVRASYTFSFQGGSTLIFPPVYYLRNGGTNAGPLPRNLELSPLYRRHQFVAATTINLPLESHITFLTQAQNGHEFLTRNEPTADPLGLLGLARRTPIVTRTDLFAQKIFKLGDTRLGLFTQINNLFNKTNIYQIGSSPAAERWIRRGDPGGYTGGPIPGTGFLPNTPRDVYIGMNFAW